MEFVLSHVSEARSAGERTRVERPMASSDDRMGRERVPWMDGERWNEALGSKWIARLPVVECYFLLVCTATICCTICAFPFRRSRGGPIGHDSCRV
eukprot:scaffold421_cov333-Pavlova_lutheri.AAC.14